MDKLIWDQCLKAISPLEDSFTKHLMVTPHLCGKSKGQCRVCYFLPVLTILICCQSVSSLAVPLLLTLFLFFLASPLFLSPVASSLSFYLNPLISVCTAISVAQLLLASSFLSVSQFSCTLSSLWGSAVRWNPSRLTFDPSVGGGTNWLVIAINAAFVWVEVECVFVCIFFLHSGSMVDICAGKRSQFKWWEALWVVMVCYGSKSALVWVPKRMKKHFSYSQQTGGYVQSIFTQTC